MEKQIFQLLIPGVGLLSGLIATYVSLQNRALLAEVRKELAEQENRIISRLNGLYVRSSECQLREENVHMRLDSITEEIRKRNAAGS
jgi:CHASE1-domain containing sensor protein